MRSRSGGASTSQWTTASRTFGAREARISRQRSAYASREPSGQPLSSYGPYWVNMVTITEPSSVSVESIVDGHSTSRYGASDGTPRQASCHARSR